MFNGKTAVLSCALALLAGCQGNSDSSTQIVTTEVDSIPAGSLCTSRSTIDLYGVQVKVADFDTDHNGCLYPDELKNATDYARQQADQQLQNKSIEVTGAYLDSGRSYIKKMIVIGNSEVSAGQVQLHSNLDGGQFVVKADLYNNGYSGEKLYVFFDDTSYAGKPGTAVPVGYEVKPPQLGNVSVLLTCQYNSTFSVTCQQAAAYYTDNLDAGIMTRTLGQEFDLSWTFSSIQVPQNGKVIASYCLTAATPEEYQCFRNFAEVPASFN